MVLVGVAEQKRVCVKAVIVIPRKSASQHLGYVRSVVVWIISGAADFYVDYYGATAFKFYERHVAIPDREE
jgi:hypothetical protein